MARPISHREAMVFACIERHRLRWARTPIWGGLSPIDRVRLQKWFEDRAAYLRSEYRALIDREFKLP